MNPNHTVGVPQNAAGLTVAYTGTAGNTAAIPTSANGVRVVSTTDCFIEITTAGTAAVANTGIYLPSFSPEYFPCPPSSIVSAIQVSVAGSIYVTPLS